jgi:hypothetical protein
MLFQKKNKELKCTNEAALRELALVRTENAQLRMMAQQYNSTRLAAAMQGTHGGMGGLGGLSALGGLGVVGFNPFSRQNF